MLLLLVSAASAASPPAFSVERGVFDTPFTLSLTPADAGDTLYYSVDGTVPTVPWPGDLAVSATTIVRAVAVGSDGTASSIATHTYLFPADIEASPSMDASVVGDATYGPILDTSLRTLPDLSLVVPGGPSISEQPASLEWIDPAGDDTQVDCGVVITGTTSLAYPKHSLRLHFRSEYGAGHWDWDVYGDDGVGVRATTHFDALSLRSGNHDTVFYLGSQGQETRNRWMDESMLELGHPGPHGRFVHLYVNGGYEGVYHVRERFGAAFLASYLGGDEDEYEAVSGGYAYDGSGAAWSQLVAHETQFQGIEDWLDVADFLDFMLLGFYSANSWDWAPDHNWAGAGPVEPGQGGYRFYMSDSDICLYYDASTNILSNGGPGYLYSSLLAEGDPDFLVALEDAIHRDLEGGGALTATAALTRYQRIADSLEDAIVPESARWGQGWWRRDTDWETERQRLETTFFVDRTDALLAQVRAAGWYPLPAPVLDTPAGTVDPGTTVTITAPLDGELWVTTDGLDPRLSGGAVETDATGPSSPQTVTLPHGATVSARLRVGDTWGPIESATYQVDEAPPVVLNEWNAVDPDETLPDGDPALGSVAGDGGDWFELLAREDVDLRGWRLVLADAGGSRGELTFSQADVLADVRAGTLVTVAEDLPEDPSYDPDHGDWRFHLRAGADGSGTYVSATPFDVTHGDWRLTIYDADGWLRGGPVGEGAWGVDGIGKDEVGVLRATPDASFRDWTADYGDADGSTFGAPNPDQDLSALRGGSSTADTDWPVWTGGGGAGGNEEEGGCGCTSSGAAPWLGLVAAAFVLRRRAALLVLAGCATTSGTPTEDDEDSAPTCYGDLDGDGAGDPSAPGACDGTRRADAGDCDDADAAVHPGADEVCDGLDDDCDGLVDDADDDLRDGLPFYADADGDGYGDALIARCAAGEGAVTVGGDCDDADAAIHPGAVQTCSDVDADCDGFSDSSAGAAADCPGTTCAELYENGVTADGPRWLALPSGTITEVWCDMTDGGWTLGLLHNSASIGNQATAGDGEVALESVAMDPAASSASATPALGWLDLNSFPYTQLRLAAYAGGENTYVSRDIDASELRVAWGEDGYKLYGGASGYYWCAGDHEYTDDGVGAVNNPDGAQPDCKGHGSLGSGWDFSETDWTNTGLTLCGADQSDFIAGSWGGTWVYYGNVGAAQAIWVK